MKQRFITALFILAITVPPLVLGGFLLDLLVVCFAMIAMYEILKCLFGRLPMSLYVLLLASLLAMVLLDLTVFLSVIPLILIVLFGFCVAHEDYSLDRICTLFVFVVLVAFTVRAIRLIYTDFGPLVMVHVCLATYMTDTGAYFFGRFFGKHKLNERISPKKTIEGSLGGWLIGALSSALFGMMLIPELPDSFLLMTSCLMPAVGQLGDLAFSAIKRHVGIKDFGNIFPGHGGVLDRIDSLIFNLILWLSLYMMFVMVM